MFRFPYCFILSKNIYLSNGSFSSEKPSKEYYNVNTVTTAPGPEFYTVNLGFTNTEKIYYNTEIGLGVSLGKTDINDLIEEKVLIPYYTSTPEFSLLKILGQ